MMLDRPLDGLGASDAAAVLGVSRWKSPLDVYNEKMGIVQPGQKSEHQEWGLLLEPAIAGRYSQITERRLRVTGTARSKKHPILYSHPDRIVVGEPGLVEIKVSRSAWDEIPIYYKTQAIQQLITTDREWVDFAVLVYGQRFMQPIPRYERDRSIEADFIAELEGWWERHIVRGEVPELDGSDAGRRYLMKAHPAGDGEIVATAAMLPLIDQYRTTYHNRKQVEAAEEKIKQQVMDLIGDGRTLVGPFGKITWNRYTQSKVNWKLLAGVYRQVAEMIATAGLSKTLEAMGGDDLIDMLDMYRGVYTEDVPTSKLTPSFKEEDDD